MGGIPYIGVPDVQAKLVQLGLHGERDALLEHFALGKDLLHGHGGHGRAHFALDDARDSVGDVAVDALIFAVALPFVVTLPFVVVLGQQYDILHEGVAAVVTGRVVLPLATGGGRRVGAARVDVGPDGEDDTQLKLQLLLGHGLHIYGIVVRLHAEALTALQRSDPGGLFDFDILDANAGDGEVLMGGGNLVQHGGGGRVLLMRLVSVCVSGGGGGGFV